MKVVLQARSQSIDDLVTACAKGELPFSGPNSLYSKITAMGYSGNSLYEMVMAKKKEIAK